MKYRLGMNPVRNLDKGSSCAESTSKNNLSEKDETQKLVEYDDRNTLSSPPIESLVECIEPPPATWKHCRFNGLQVKRLKMENEEFEQTKPEVDDDCTAFGRCIAAQLKQMPKVQKLLAERLIAEVCFRGQMQSLQMNTTLTAPVFQQSQPYPVYMSRPSNFNRGTEYVMVNQHRPHAPIPQNAVPQQYQNFISMQQQSEHTQGLNPMVNAGSTENMQ